VCPICETEVEASTIAQHANQCFLQQIDRVRQRPSILLEPPEKQQHETWGDYYRRKGATFAERNFSINPTAPPQAIIHPPSPSVPIPSHLS
jgi:hypothetical protein